jgi:hypothetical protein
MVVVIGPAHHDLVAPFAAYYSALGVNEFRVALHCPPGTTAAARARALAACERAVGRPAIVSGGHWLVETNGLLRDRLRELAAADWHVVADADELQFHPGGIAHTIERCVASGVPFATGLFVDRLAGDAADPAPGPWTPEALDAAFPLGSFLTAELLDGDPRKITLARRDVSYGSPGNHFTASHAHVEHPFPAPVHHFKWRAGVRDYLAQRARQFAGRAERSDIGVRNEALRAVELLAAGPGAVGERLRTFAASLQRLPEDWEGLAGGLWRYWQEERPLERAPSRRS